MVLRSNDILKLRWDDFAGCRDVVHVARAGYAGNRLAIHRHDFAELFWIEKGQAHHHINGQRQTLPTHQLIWIRPKDAHGLSCSRRQPFTLMNIAFDPDRVTSLLRRYFNQHVKSWNTDALPVCITLEPTQAGQLSQLADQLAGACEDAAMLDAFLLLAMSFSLNPVVREQAPLWLRRAMVAMDSLRADELTVDRFVAGCGKTREHVNRVMRASQGMTTTHWLLTRKLEQAARELRFTQTPIAAVALDCGFENLGYFYKCFNKRFRVTPRQYRLRARATV